MAEPGHDRDERGDREAAREPPQEPPREPPKRKQPLGPAAFDPNRTPTRPLWAPVRRSLWAIPAGLALTLLAFALRAVLPAADPPGWLASGPAAFADGPVAVAAAAARVGEGYGGPDVDRDLRLGRPLVTWSASLAFRLPGGFAPERASLYAACSGAALVLVVFLSLLALAGDRVAIAGAAAMACDAVLIGWARTPHPVTLTALGATLAVVATAYGRGRPLAVLAGIAIAAATAYGASLAAGVAVVPVLALGLQALARHRGERGRLALWVVLALFVTAATTVLVASPALVGRGIAHAHAAFAGLDAAAIIARVAGAATASRVGLAAPIALALALAAPLCARRGEAVGKTRTSVQRALVTLVALGLLSTSLLVPEEPTAVVALYPAVIVLFVLSLDGLELGGARRPRVAGLAWFALSLAAAMMLLDAGIAWLGLARELPPLVERALAWLGAPGPPTVSSVANRLLLAAAPAAVVAGLASRETRSRRLDRRPGLARVLFGAHMAMQLALILPSVVAPRGTLQAARADVHAIVPAGATLVGDHAHALAMGAPIEARLPLADAEATLCPARERARGATHIVVDEVLYHAETRPRARRDGVPYEEVVSLFVGERRLKLLRLEVPVPARSAFEEARASLEGGSLGAASVGFASALDEHPDASLPCAMLALTTLFEGSHDEAGGLAQRARRRAPSSVPALLVEALVQLRRDRSERAATSLGRAAAIYPSPALRRMARELGEAVARGDARTVEDVSRVRLPLLIGDLLR